MTVLHKPSQEEPWIIACKEAGLPTAPLFEGDRSALTELLKDFPQITSVQGKKAIEYGLVHRIDTETSGLFMVATSQEFFDYIQNEQSQGRFIKEYQAQTDSYLLEDPSFAPWKEKGEDNFICKSYFRTFGKKGALVRPVTEESGTAALKKCQKKLYSTEITITNGRALCTISQGFRHQVRCHLAWSGHPVKGDQLYNPRSKEGEKMLFSAVSLEFTDMNGEKRKYNME